MTRRTLEPSPPGRPATFCLGAAVGIVIAATVFAVMVMAGALG